MSLQALPLHLGALHPVESYAMAVLALVPFVVLAAVVTVVSRRDRRRDAEERPRSGQATRDDRVPRDPTRSATTETAAPQSVQQ